MKRLILSFLLLCHSAFALDLEVRTHDNQNPFGTKSIIRISTEERSWREGQIHPAVQILSGDTNVESNPRDFRQGTGFISGRWKASLQQGVLVTTANHVLSGPNRFEAVTFFDQKTGKSLFTRNATVLATLPLSDLAILKVELTQAEADAVILPALMISTGTETSVPNMWKTETLQPLPVSYFSTKPPETSLQSYATTDSHTAKSLDRINPLAVSQDFFWYTPRSFHPGMSGGPLVVPQYHDAIVGALGYIYDLGSKDGYAYPLDSQYISALNFVSVSESFTTPFVQTIKIPDGRTISINIEGRTEQISFFNSHAFGFVSKMMNADRSLVMDSSVITISGCTVSTTPCPEGKSRNISLSQLNQLRNKTSQPATGTPGAAGGSNGTSGGAGGSNGTNGGSGGSNGTPGSGDPINAPKQMVIDHFVNLFAGEAFELDGIAEVLGSGQSPTVRPLMFVRDALRALINTDIALFGGTLGYRLRKLIPKQPVVEAALDLKKLSAIFTDMRIEGPLRMSSNKGSRGRFLFRESGSAVSGQFTVGYRTPKDPKVHELTWEGLIFFSPQLKHWILKKSQFSLDGQTLNLVPDANYHLIPKIEGDQLTLTIIVNNEAIGEVRQ